MLLSGIGTRVRIYPIRIYPIDILHTDELNNPMTGTQPEILKLKEEGHQKRERKTMCMDRGAWWATVHGVAPSPIRLKRLGAHTHTHTHTSTKGVGRRAT